MIRSLNRQSIYELLDIFKTSYMQDILQMAQKLAGYSKAFHICWTITDVVQLEPTNCSCTRLCEVFFHIILTLISKYLYSKLVQSNLLKIFNILTINTLLRTSYILHFNPELNRRSYVVNCI